MYAGCPILWVRITTSNESCIKFNRAEYIALSQATRNLIPFMNLVEDILLILSIDYIIQEVQYKNTKTASNIFADVYEDNNGALELAKVRTEDAPTNQAHRTQASSFPRTRERW